MQAYWDTPVYGEYQEPRADRVDARIVKNRDKQVIALEMSCSWVSNRDKKTSEKTMKCAPLRWELNTEVPRVRDQPVLYHLGCTRVMVQGFGCQSTDDLRH